MKCIMEFLFEVGQLALKEGEDWRLDHPGLMDAYQACLDDMFKEQEEKK